MKLQRPSGARLQCPCCAGSRAEVCDNKPIVVMFNLTRDLLYSPTVAFVGVIAAVRRLMLSQSNLGSPPAPM